ncbi:hypothetical protein IT575_15495 [bacterium]|nr:hypothetical protein [bacterium]
MLVKQSSECGPPFLTRATSTWGPILFLALSCLSLTSCGDPGPEVIGAQLQNGTIVIEAQDGIGGLQMGNVYVVTALELPPQLPDNGPRYERSGNELLIDDWKYTILNSYEDQGLVSRWLPAGVKKRRGPNHRFLFTLPDLDSTELEALQAGRLFVFVEDLSLGAKLFALSSDLQSHSSQK